MINLPLAAKKRNGPRFAEGVDTFAEHIAGATELPELKPRQKRAARPAEELGPIVAGPPITDIGFESADPRGRLVAVMIEREAARKRKEAGAPPPWTTEPILNIGRFCNVYREHDAVTRWITANVVERFRDDSDLWFAITLARCINEPDALVELLPQLLPFDAEHCLAVLQTRQARGEKVFRTEAYKPPTPPTKGASTAEFLIMEVLAPMWREREALRPRPGDSLDATSARLEACYKIGPFLAAQVIADLKHVAPLEDAPDWWVFARPGPGSERGLNRIRGRDVGKSWSPMAWYRELLALQTETKDRFAAAGLAPLDAQNLQNCLCEYDKWERARDNNGKPARRYQPAAATESKPRSKKPKPAKPTATLASEQKPVSTDSIDAAEQDVLDYIREQEALRTTAEPAQQKPTAPPAPTPTPTPNKASAPPGDNGSGETHRRHSSAGESPHGSAEAPRGNTLATYIYEHPDYPPPHFYLLVEKCIDAAGKRNFFQYHWAGGRWHFNVKGTYAERKIPYRLPELKTALAADRNAEVQITEGEKDAETLGRLGFIATTNPGGAAQWTDDLTAWLRVLGVRRVVLHEDHDKAGRERTAQLSAALADFATVQVARYIDTPEGEVVTYWVETLGHTKAELEARIAAAEPATVGLPYINMANWDHEPVPEQQWSVDGRIPRRQTALFSGEGGAGKSIIQLHLSVAAVLGRDWLGAIPEQGPAVFIDCEDDQDVLHYRLAALAQHYDACFTELVQRGLHLISLVGQDQVLATVSRSGLVEPTALYKQLLQAAGDIKPAMMGIAATANVFAGNESDRSQVQQFVNMTTRLAMLANGALVLISHPSLTGIASGTGLSGSTQWHNAVRARFFLKTPKAEEGEPPAHDLREIEFKKNQYGAMPESIPLRWQSGMFLPIDGATFTRAEQEMRAEAVFLELLQRFNADHRHVSDNKSSTYAPALFTKESTARAAGLTSTQLAAAMRRLFDAGKIHNEPHGPPSRPRFHLAIKP